MTIDGFVRDGWTVRTVELSDTPPDGGVFRTYQRCERRGVSPPHGAGRRNQRLSEIASYLTIRKLRTVRMKTSVLGNASFRGNYEVQISAICFPDN